MKQQTAQPRVSPRPKADLAEDLVRLLNRRWRLCRKNLARLEAGHHGAEDIHQTRVSARKLISLLDVVIALTQEKTLAKARKGLKRQFSLFSPVRDADVQCGHLHELSARFPQVEPFYRTLLKRKKTLSARARKELAVPGKLSRKLQKRLVGRLREHLFLDHEIFSRIKAAFDQVRALRAAVVATVPESLHRLRVGFKKFRYSVSAVHTLLPVIRPSAFGRMRTVQGRLGEIQDLSVLMSRLQKLAGKKLADHAGSLQPVLQALKAEETTKINEVLRNLDGQLAFKLHPPTE